MDCAPASSPTAMTPALARLLAAIREERPIAASHARLGVRVESVQPGACTAQMRSGPILRDPADRLDVGALLALADAALGIAVGSALPVGWRIATLRIWVSTVRTAAPGPGVLRAVSRLRFLTEDFGTSSGTIADPAGRVLAQISTRCAVFEGESRTAAKQTSFAGIARAAGMEALAAVAGPFDGVGIEVTGRAAPELSNNGGIVQGGALGALAEFAQSRAITAAAPSLTAADAQDLELVYLRGVHANGGALTCQTKLEHVGSHLAVARASVAGTDGRTALLAAATRFAGRRRPVALPPANGVGSV